MNEETCIEELLNGLNMGLVAIDHLIDKIENTQLRLFYFKGKLMVI